MLVDGIAHIGVLLARACEQLDREDIGVAVDDAPREHRATLGHLLGAIAHARHENVHQQEVAAEPERHGNCQHRIRGREQDERGRAVHHDVPDASQERDDGLADRGTGLHHPVSDAAGKVMLKERLGLPHNVPVVLPADAIGYIRGETTDTFTSTSPMSTGASLILELTDGG
jgi:hypothetical protein